METVKTDPEILPCKGNIKKQKLSCDYQATGETPPVSNDAVPAPCLSDIKAISRRVYKNLTVLSLAMMLTFTAVYCVFNLQSIIHPDIGTMSLAGMHVGRTISSCVISSWLIKKITAKWSIIVGIVGYSSFSVAHFYPRTYTLYPTAVLMGLGAAPLWAGLGSYIKRMGTRYASLNSEDIEIVHTRMFGLFFACNQLSFGLESIVTASVLKVHTETNITNTMDTVRNICGISSCPDDGQYSNKNSSVSLIAETAPPPWEEIVVIISIMLSLYGIGALIIIMFLEPIDSIESKEQMTVCSSTDSSEETRCNYPRLLAITPDLLFIAPLPLWSGFLQGFFFSDYSKAFVHCGIGVHMLGPVMAVFGIVATIGALVLGPIVRRVGQSPVIAAGGVSCGLLIVLMYVWTSNPQHSWILFLGSGLGGLADVVGQSQVRALFGSTFPHQPIESSSTLLFLESLGFFLTYVLQSTVCTHAKIILLIVILIITMSGFGIRIVLLRYRSASYMVKK